MANYFARVELHGARWPEDYAELHASLEDKGFTNCVPTRQSGTKRLPTGTYYASNLIDDVSVVAGSVKKCANDTGYKNEVVVVVDRGARLYLSREC